MSQSRSNAERFVLERMLAALPSDQYAIHDSVEWMAAPNAPPGKAEGEIDFVICHRTRGVLVLEVKGGGVEFDTATGEWWSIDRHGARHAIADPMRQARQSARHLIGVLKDAVGGFLPIPVGAAVAFPDVRWTGPRPLDWPAELLLDRESCASMSASIGRALDYWTGRFPPRGELTVAAWKAMNRTLRPKGSQPPLLASIVTSDERRIEDLTNQQLNVLSALKHFPRLRVSGVAGSGKTMIAVAESARLAREGQRVLLLCFNRLLADFMKRAAANEHSIRACSFHELCESMAPKATAPATPKERNSFYDELLPAAAFDALPSFTERYDAIVVDEGQDFRPAWWVLVESLLVQNGRLVIFYDPRQDIFGVGPSLPIDTPPVELSFNCRSTHAIARAASAFVGFEPPAHPGVLAGEAPVIRGYSEGPDLVASVDAVVKELLGEGLSAEQLVVLSPRRFEHSALCGTATLGGLALVEKRGKAKGELWFATLQSFKGLEADVVLLVDVDLDHARSAPANLYVGFSRAKHRLHVWVRSEQKAKLAAMMTPARHNCDSRPTPDC